MARTERAKPSDLTPEWPETESTNPVGEVARQFALNLRTAIGERSIRNAADAAGVHHVTLLGILAGRTWPDLATIAKLELGLEADLWPGRLPGVEQYRVHNT